MTFKRSAQTILRGLTLGIYLWLSMSQKPALAATLDLSAPMTDTKILLEAKEFPKLESAVDQYLMVMPKRGFAEEPPKVTSLIQSF